MCAGLEASSDPSGASRLAELYALETPALLAWTRLRLLAAGSARVDAEDVVQDVWLRVLAGLAAFDATRAPFRAWLYGIARHAVAHARRAARRAADGSIDFDRIADAAADTLGDVQRAEDATALHRAIARLRDTDRRIVGLHALEGRSLDDAAALLGLRREAVKKRWQRLRRRLAAATRRVRAGPQRVS